MAISGIVMSTISLFLLVIFWACLFVSAAKTESTDSSTYYYEGYENDAASGDYYDGLYEGYQQGYKDGYYDGYYGYYVMCLHCDSVLPFLLSAPDCLVISTCLWCNQHLFAV